MNKRTALIITTLAVITVIAYNSFFYWNTRAKNTDSTMIRQLSDVMILPDGDPKIATVVDAVRLKEKDVFYKLAENGDKVVIWKQRAIIYRPSTRKIVDFGIVIQ